MEGEVLSGGNLNSVVRIGDTVRRQVGTWSRVVHQLLLHLEERGFEGTPRFLGIDEQGREVLSFLPGNVGFMSYIWQDSALIEAARLLRRFHDTTQDFKAPLDANWQWSYPDVRRHEVICHVDFAPYNIVFREQKPYRLIDFDFVGPGPRLWDLAMAAYWFVPLSFGSNLRERSQQDMEAQSRRLHLVCSSYGTSASEELLDMVEARLAFLCELIETRAQAGEASWIKMRDEGHLSYWQEELAAFQEQKVRLKKNLQRLA